MRNVSNTDVLKQVVLYAVTANISWRLPTLHGNEQGGEEGMGGVVQSVSTPNLMLFCPCITALILFCNGCIIPVINSTKPCGCSPQADRE